MTGMLWDWMGEIIHILLTELYRFQPRPHESLGDLPTGPFGSQQWNQFVCFFTFVPP